MRLSKYMLTILFMAFCPLLNAQSFITLHDESDGRLTLDAKVNGVGVKTYYTEESWFASVSSTTYLFLYENGYIQDRDVKGMTVLKMRDGSSTKAGSFVIRNLRIDNVIVKDLPAFVINKQNVPLVIGNSAFDCFGEVSRDGNRLIINDAEEVIAETEEALDPVDSLRNQAQALLDEKDYEGAAVCFAKLYRQDALNAFGGYQYIVVQNILGHGAETISLAEEWLGENEGKSLTMDYWVYDCLGDAYSSEGDNRKALEGDNGKASEEDTDKAISNYEKAVSAYYKLFNTNEKTIMKSNFRDETLGDTLYKLGRLYATKGNVRNAERYCAMAAKSGNAQAIEFCDKYKVKY